MSEGLVEVGCVADEYGHIRKQRCHCGGRIAVTMQQLEHMDDFVKIDCLTTSCLECGAQQHFRFALRKPKKRPLLLDLTLLGFGCAGAVVAWAATVLFGFIGIYHVTSWKDRLFTLALCFVAATAALWLTRWLKRKS
ncbi:MAG: hypothetical protein KDC35_13485 [Acidobacteria bacterium]|nr:hypothetical protein [Acidobacteriota bacterium]